MFNSLFNSISYQIYNNFYIIIIINIIFLTTTFLVIRKKKKFLIIFCGLLLLIVNLLFVFASNRGSLINKNIQYGYLLVNYIESYKTSTEQFPDDINPVLKQNDSELFKVNYKRNSGVENFNDNKEYYNLSLNDKRLSPEILVYFNNCNCFQFRD